MVVVGGLEVECLHAAGQAGVVLQAAATRRARIMRLFTEWGYGTNSKVLQLLCYFQLELPVASGQRTSGKGLSLPMHFDNLNG